MNYPVWELNAAGGGLLIAVIAVVHVYIAHFAVGGGLLLVLTELKARRVGSEPLMAHTRRHARFFMLLTMVGGAVTGVGIWFTIALLNPAATSILIHTFVFGWATEWVCFAGEIVALLVYYYGFDRLAARDHLRVGWLYFIFAWLSLFWVNGIIDFMLTPGRWPDTGGFWTGFFNPTMLPALGFRTALCLVFAGVFGMVTAAWFKGLPEDERRDLVRYHAGWLIYPMAVLALFGIWYWQALPADLQSMIAGRSPELDTYYQGLMLLPPLLMALGVLCVGRFAASWRKPLTLVILIIGLFTMGAFEFLREGARRPYVINGVMYASAIKVADREKIDADGFLAHARWVSEKEVTDANRLKMGKEIFRVQCAACHSVGGPMNDILPLTAKFSHFGMDAQLNGQGKLLNYMPPFMGTRQERQALAAYIVQGFHGKETPKSEMALSQNSSLLPAFDESKDEYVLVAWSRMGMHQLTDCDAQWSLASPGATLYAQLIRRGETPEIVTDPVTLHYRTEQGYASPSGQTDFWKFSKSLYGKPVDKDAGVSGTRPTGTLQLDENLMAFVTKDLPLVPYPQTGGFNPYPQVEIEAREPDSGRVIASTRVTVPVSTELGCRNCHGGPWRVDQKAGISKTTAEDILTVHDRISKTQLKKEADQGRPVRCQSCHGDGLRGDKGRPEMLNISAAVHGFHALYLTRRGEEACNACHPGNPQGATRMLRGIHNSLEMTCVNCHGPMEDHALGLLKAEAAAGKPRAERLVALIRPTQSESLAQVPARTPWFNQPDCLHCHVEFEPPDTDETTPQQRTASEQALFRLRSDDAGILCGTCHGSPHALYPARNPYDPQQDVIAPRQYQKSPYPLGSNRNCKVCHTIDMEDPIHHPNMLGEFRNTVD
ncbi:MAG: cytochrome ubiquinol oxidase subunit I [Desulfobacteraceae bacterium]